MNSGLLKLNTRDFKNGLFVTVFAAMLTMILGWLNAPDFSLSSFNWVGFIQIILTSGISYLLKNLATDEDGKVFGRI